MQVIITLLTAAVATVSACPGNGIRTLDVAGSDQPFEIHSIVRKNTKPITKATNHLEVKRTTIQNDCSSEQRSALAAANQECARLANGAAEFASSGAADMFELYFGDSSENTRDTVSKNFNRIAEECSNTPGGNSETHCTDPYGSCGGNLLAYAVWRDSYGANHDTERSGTMYYCPRFFNNLPAKGQRCHQQSQASNALHETSHAVLGTDDVVYGYAQSTRLSTSQAINNADSYALFANDIDLDCGTDGGSQGQGSPFGSSPITWGSAQSDGSSGDNGASAPTTGGSQPNWAELFSSMFNRNG
ncbi:hypothetical protein MBLNU230_g4303t1 [Neophaeotheca triangularis]